MDAIDGKIVELLAADARRSLADIGGSVGLSTSAVNERIRRMVESGTIRRFTVEADPAALGRPLTAFIWIELARDADEAAFRRFAGAHGRVEECHHVTGAWSYLLKVRMAALAEVEAFLTELKAQRLIARSETVLALSTVVDAFVPASPEHGP